MSLGIILLELGNRSWCRWEDIC